MSIDDTLRAEAESILAALPLSIEKPAGTGKTQLVAGLAALIEERGKRALILTHTHAGVEAIRNRLRAFGLARSSSHVDTITGWAFDLTRNYPLLSGVAIPEEPNWDLSDDYIRGAVSVAQSPAIRNMHAARFDYLIVDEYQDCDELKHDFVVALASAIPRVCVLGDPLQGIFDFANPLIAWARVEQTFPPHPSVHVPHRWIGHNDELGQWLLDIRPSIFANESIDLSAVSVAGLAWVRSGPDVVRNVALGSWPAGESVLVLGQWPSDAEQIARDLMGVYGVMEPVQGKFMLEHLARFDANGPAYFARGLALLAKACFVGLSGIDRAVLEKLHGQQSVGHLTRAGIEPVLSALDVVLARPSLAQLRLAMIAIESTNGLRLFRREAWVDVKRAVEASVDSGDPMAVSMARVRDALRRNGRRDGPRVVSRTVLVKGLEYDHVVVADASLLTTAENVYVAMSRARRTLTVVNETPTIVLRQSRRALGA